ncbi:MAG: DUF5666 domain-containing protein [Anaerolineae bacterium]|nr:DUF5666 domain-containing protein [Anaerolineae bacterium]
MGKQSYRRMFSIFVFVGLLLALPFGFSMAQAVVPPADAVGQIELVGLVEAMTVDTITINQQTIDISTAQVNTVLELAAAVKVEGWLLADGTIAAREVNALAPGDVLPGEIEVVGVVTALDAASITVSGLTIDISTAQMAAVVVGDTVKVHASFDAAGLLVAREVALYTPDSGTPGNDNTADNSNDNGSDDNSNDNSGAPVVTDEEFELRGTLEAVGDGFITVAGQTINTLQAEIKGQLQVGAMVKVHLTLVNGELVAKEVELASREQHTGDDSNDNSNDSSDDNSNDNAAVVIPVDCVPAMPAGWTTYVIQSGDTLSGIAAGSGSTVGELAVANCIQDPRFVVVGMEIFVPTTPDRSFFNSNGNSNDNVDDHSSDNGDDHSDDNGDDHSNDNGDDDSHDDKGDDSHDNDNGNDNH